MDSLARDWPAYVMVGGFFLFVAYVYVSSHRASKNEQKKDLTDFSDKKRES